MDYSGMDYQELGKLLTARERRFIEELDNAGDGNGTQAAIRAGYKPGKENKSAAVAASRLLKNPKVSAYRHARARYLYESLGITPETINTRTYEVYRRCMQAEPVMEWDREKKEWVPSGVWQFDAKNALKALELMGKSQGMFVDKVINENRNMSLEDYLKMLEEKGAKEGARDDGHQEPVEVHTDLPEDKDQG